MENSKWRGSIEVPVVDSLQRVWEILNDFYGLKKWQPNLLVCERVEGTPTQGPGCVRSLSFPSPSSPEKTSWAKEELTSLDCANHCYSYTIIDTNVEGIEGYEATLQVIEGMEEDKCIVKWSFELNPVDGLSQQEFVGNFSSVLTAAIKSLQDAISCP
ncbi:hypothetical protein SUGI_1096250 [Cryptomeria japonica]|uniref:lachrymatory-factor synthase-like n=1 Tax=Cryptomeria japonica TaxID=3369 RepID=UPI00241476DC|nr:lachrymatory-factor synthase-like [Cryptomeria japonica]GLJ51578.1 hypothetical protein SUGI_1096250 [Cryptomeria japonica]